MPNTITNAAEASSPRITEPGKFEGEPRYVPNMWDMVLDGCYAEDLCIPGDTTDTLYSLITLAPEDVERWPELRGVHSVVLWETDQGFVRHYLVAKGYNECCSCGELVIDAIVCDDCLAGYTECEEG